MARPLGKRVSLSGPHFPLCAVGLSVSVWNISGVLPRGLLGLNLSEAPPMHEPLSVFPPGSMKFPNMGPDV